MNRYVSKYFTIRKRKFHILKLLLEINPEDIITENIKKIEEKLNNLDEDDLYNIKKNKELLDEITNFRERYIYIYASFKNAAEYVCENNKSLENTCDGFVLDDSTSEEDKQQIIESVKQLLLIPVAEYDKFAVNGVYPLANKSHF
jgi:phosphoenolpyruvate carboxylase